MIKYIMRVVIPLQVLLWSIKCGKYKTFSPIRFGHMGGVRFPWRCVITLKRPSLW